ncbi:MAG: polysaccharide deacetylase family protein [Flavobacteriales bacterium]
MDSKLTYFLKNFSLVYSSEIEKTNIGYDESCAVQISNSDFENPFENLANIIWKDWKGRSIPFLKNSERRESIIQKKEKGVIIYYDIISAGWYLMSGAQELDDSKKDNYGRFTHEESIQNKLKITQIPVVNYYFDILKEAIEIVTSTKVEKRNKFSATVTHDIDEVLSGWKHRIRTQLEKKRYLKAISFGFSHFIKPFHPWKNLVELSEFNTKNRVNSTFFILPRNNKLDEIKNADYSLSDSYVQNSLTKINESNHELGIHGSYKTHDSSTELKSDILSLSFPVAGNRFHFLQFDINNTPKVLNQVGIKYDTTLGFQESIGFRNSICTPFYLYDFEEKKAFDFLEIPLNVMDCSLEFENYMNLNSEESFEEIKKLIQEVKKFNGNVCINWHNTYFSDYLKSDWKKLYKKVIKYLESENCSFLTCSKLTDSYR